MALRNSDRRLVFGRQGLPTVQPRRDAAVRLVLTPLALVLPLVANSQPQENSDEVVVVTSSRVATPVREVGTAVSVITSEDIELRGFNSMADLLRSQPGIGVSNAGGAGKQTSLRIRGEEGYRTLVLIDGVEVSDPTGTQVGPTFSHIMTTSDLERVEILRGPQGFMYGADAGGVVNIMTRNGEGDLQGQVGLESGKFGTQQVEANVSAGSETGEFFVSVSDTETDGFNSREADSVVGDDDGYDNTTIHAKFGINVGDSGRLQLVARDIDARNEFDNCGFPTVHDCVGETEQSIYRLSADFGSDSLTHSFAYGVTDIDRDNLTSGVSSFATEGELNRLEYTGSYRPSESATIVYGIDLEEEDIIASDGQAMQRDQDAFYFEYQRRINDNFFVTAGARVDDNDDFGEHTSARATIAYLSDLSGGASIKYRASYGTGFRAPSLSEIAYNRGPFSFPPASNLILNEETSGGYDLGIEVTTDSGLYFEATYFDQEIKDEIFFDLSGFSGYLQTPGTIQSQGIELATTLPLNDQWSLTGNLTFNDTEDSSGQDRIRRPKRLGNVGVQYASTDEKFRFFAGYRLSQDSTDEIFGLGRFPLDDYEVLDLSATYAVSDLIEVYGRIENATDEDYRETIGFFTGGSAAYGGVRLRF